MCKSTNKQTPNEGLAGPPDFLANDVRAGRGQALLARGREFRGVFLHDYTLSFCVTVSTTTTPLPPQHTHQHQLAEVWLQQAVLQNIGNEYTPCLPTKK